MKAETISKWDQDKFGQTSYHWVIELDGTVERTLLETQKGAHTGGANTGNVGICYVGGVAANLAPKDTRTAAQRKAMAELVRSYRARFPALIVRGHRDWPGVKKACPSFDVAGWINAGMN